MTDSIDWGGPQWYASVNNGASCWTLHARTREEAHTKALLMIRAPDDRLPAWRPDPAFPANALKIFTPQEWLEEETKIARREGRMR